MMFQVALYLFMFVIPFFMLTYSTLSPVCMRLCVYVSLSGAVCMFCYEVIATVVEGPKIHFNNSLGRESRQNL